MAIAMYIADGSQLLAAAKTTHTTSEELSMKKILAAVLALSLSFVFGAAFAADAAKPAAAKEVCKDKAGKEVKCPEKKKMEDKKAK